MTNEALSTDVVIVGAGPAGSATAGLLARRGRRVLLLDRARFPRDKTCGDGLTPRAVAVLDRLGLLPELLAAGYQRIHGARLVAPTGRTFSMHFADYNLGLPGYGLVVPRFELDERLRQWAVAQGAQFRAGIQVSRPMYERGRVVGVESEAVNVRAPLTVVATGASIGLHRALGILKQMPPGVNAIRGYFTGVVDLGGEFEFYFDRELLPGYAWVFPLSDGRANVGLGVLARNGADETPNVRRLLADFMARQPRLRNAQAVGPAKGYPLRIDFPRYRPIGAGFLLAGEALGLVNPVTGEGIDLALESAELAAAAADNALRQGNVGEPGLRPYARALGIRFGSFFRGIHLLLRLAMGSHAIDVLIRQADRKPHLARIIAGINLGMVSPWVAFSPRTWWDILM